MLISSVYSIRLTTYCCTFGLLLIISFSFVLILLLPLLLFFSPMGFPTSHLLCLFSMHWVYSCFQFTLLPGYLCTFAFFGFCFILLRLVTIYFSDFWLSIPLQYDGHRGTRIFGYCSLGFFSFLFFFGHIYVSFLFYLFYLKEYFNTPSCLLYSYEGRKTCLRITILSKSNVKQRTGVTLTFFFFLHIPFLVQFITE